MSNDHHAQVDVTLSRGFDAGNYGNAYENEDWQAWLERKRAKKQPKAAKPAPELVEAWEAAAILGFFGSYELHEIPDSARDAFIEAYLSEYGLMVLEAGYCDIRPDVECMFSGEQSGPDRGERAARLNRILERGQ